MTLTSAICRICDKPLFEISTDCESVYSPSPHRLAQGLCWICYRIHATVVADAKCMAEMFAEKKS